MRVQSSKNGFREHLSRRRELLALLGIPFIVHPGDVDEGPLGWRTSGQTWFVRLSVAKVRRVAQEKASPVHRRE